MRFIEAVFTLIFLALAFVVVFRNSSSQMDYEMLRKPRFTFEKPTGIIDEPFHPHGRVLLPPEMVELAVPKVVLPKIINATKERVQQDE